MLAVSSGQGAAGFGLTPARVARAAGPQKARPEAGPKVRNAGLPQRSLAHPACRSKNSHPALASLKTLFGVPDPGGAFDSSFCHIDDGRLGELLEPLQAQPDTETGLL